jgi:aspartyl aminopeptidase
VTTLTSKTKESLSSSQQRVSALWGSKQARNKSEQDRFNQFLAQTLNGPVVERLKEILERELELLSSQETSLTSYDKAAWAYRQAHLNGKREALKMVIDLITIKETKPTG